MFVLCKKCSLLAVHANNVVVECICFSGEGYKSSSQTGTGETLGTSTSVESHGFPEQTLVAVKSKHSFCFAFSRKGANKDVCIAPPSSFEMICNTVNN